MSIRSHTSSLFLLILVVSCSANRSHLIPNAAATAPSATPLQSATTEQKEKLTQAQGITKRWVKVLTFRTKTTLEKHGGYCPYEMSADYPQLLSTRAHVRNFNRWIKRRVMGDVARFRHLELRAEPRARRGGKRLGTEGLELTFAMYYVSDRMVSVRLTHRVMAAGQMHPINYYETINYDLAKHRPLRAAEVFKGSYVQALAAYSREWLRQTYEISNEDWLKEGTAARVENFSNWNLVPDGVLISFEDYQVSSHSFGQPELIIPYSVLRRYLHRSDLIRHFGARETKNTEHSESYRGE